MSAVSLPGAVTSETPAHCARMNSSKSTIPSQDEYLWCKFKEQTNKTESLLKDYVDIEPIQGVAGCDTMLDLNLSEHFTFGVYDYFRGIV